LDISRENLRISLDQDIEESVINKIIQAYDDFVIQKKPLEYIL
jgi:hypothetical protein